MAAAGELETKILLAIKEAAEDHVPALLNRVIEGDGSPDAVDSFSGALANLMEEDLLRLARSRQPGQAKLKTLSQAESIAVLAHLKSLLVWRPEENIWKWNEAASIRMDVVLTDGGIAAAQEAGKAE